MKVFSLQAQIYRAAWLSSRLTAQTSQLAAVRRDALERWRRARSRGLSAEEAARAVGASRASLYRWEKRLEPRSRRPHRQRQPTWTSALMRQESSGCALIIRCGASVSSPSSCAGRGSPSRSRSAAGAPYTNTSPKRT